MVHSIFHGNVRNGERIDTLQAAHVEAVLPWIRTTLVVRVDAARAAEEVLRGVGVELVKLELVRTFHDVQTGERYRRDHRSLPTTDGTVAAARIDDALRQLKLELDGAAVAGRAVAGLDGNAANFLDHLSGLHGSAGIYPTPLRGTSRACAGQPAAPIVPGAATRRAALRYRQYLPMKMPVKPPDRSR